MVLQDWKGAQIVVTKCLVVDKEATSQGLDHDLEEF